MAIQARTEMVTPELAGHYLKRNVDNYRKISKAKAAYYAEEMKAGRWQTNGETIVFDESGKLKDGQHRLAAIMIAGTPIEMTIITGVSDDVTIYDTGMNRSMKQIAQASGCGDISSTETAAATWIVGDFNNRTPKGIVLDWLRSNYAEINRAYRICGANNKRNLACRAGAVIATYMMLQVNEMKCYDLELFFKIFNSGNVVGTDGYEPSSALVARRQFEERYKMAPTDKRRMMEQVEILVNAISDFSKGKKRQLNYQVKEPMNCESMMVKLRKNVGLENPGDGEK